MLAKLEHLKPLKRLDGVRIVQNRDELMLALQKNLFETPIIINRNKLEWIVNTSPGTFSKRFTSLLIKLLHENGQSNASLPKNFS